MVEIFFGIITCRAIHRSTFTSVKDLITAIGRFTGARNDRRQLFTGAKDAGELPDKIKPSRTNVTLH